MFNWLFARREGGTFLLRFDDTDLERSKQEYVEGIRDDLTWLGLTWDAEFRQSERFAFYEETAEKLKKAGRLYACYETAEELERRRKRQMARGLPPVYGRRAQAHAELAASSGDCAPIPNGKKCFVLQVTMTRSCAFAMPAIMAPAIPG